MTVPTTARAVEPPPDCPPPSWNEAERFAALVRYNILDTPPEPEFDDITRVVALVCRAPIAVVNLIGDTRQFFKAEVGLGVRETPLDSSFCARAILQPGLTVVRDARLDPRFSSNPLVTGEPHLRFYAGAPLETPEGLPIGTVCVLDTVPRPDGLTPEQAEIMSALARQAMTHLELRRALEAQDLLSRELSHRIQNVFTVVGGLVTMSARRSGEAARAFAEDFRDRVGALARANEFVRPSGAGPAEKPTLHRLLRLLLAPYDEGRVAIAGDDPLLEPQAASALALVVHEMATNAMKYGALSAPEGRLRIVSKLADARLIVTWVERGGPGIDGKPDRQGFGSTITARTVQNQLGGEMEYDWAPDGLTLTLRMPRSALAAPAVP